MRVASVFLLVFVVLVVFTSARKAPFGKEELEASLEKNINANAVGPWAHANSQDLANRLSLRSWRSDVFRDNDWQVAIDDGEQAVDKIAGSSLEAGATVADAEMATVNFLQREARAAIGESLRSKARRVMLVVLSCVGVRAVPLMHNVLLFFVLVTLVWLMWNLKAPTAAGSGSGRQSEARRSGKTVVQQAVPDDKFDLEADQHSFFTISTGDVVSEGGGSDTDDEATVPYDLQSSATLSVLPATELLATSPAASIDYQAEFIIQSSDDGVPRSYRWMLPEEAEAEGLLHAKIQPRGNDVESVGSRKSVKRQSDLSFARVAMSNGAWFDPLASPWTTETLNLSLAKCGINVNEWTQDMVSKLAGQLAGKDPKVFLVKTKDGRLVRKVDMVLLIIAHPETGFVLMEDEQKRPLTDKSMLKSPEMVVSTRKRGKESVWQAANRCLEKKLLAPAGAIELNWAMVKSYDEEDADAFYPGLKTIVRRHVMQGRLVTKDIEKLNALQAVDLSSLGEGQGRGFETRMKDEVYFWVWKSLRWAPPVAQHLSWLNGVGAVQSRPLDDDLQIVQAWSVARVEALLREHNVEASNFGFSVEQLSEKASSGHIYFALRGPDGALGCISDSVKLRLLSPSGKAVLVETTAGRVQWPSGEKWLNETWWEAAQRLVRRRWVKQDALVYVGFETHDIPVVGGAGGAEPDKLEQGKVLLGRISADVGGVFHVNSAI